MSTRARRFCRAGLQVTLSLALIAACADDHADSPLFGAEKVPAAYVAGAAAASLGSNGEFVQNHISAWRRSLLTEAKARELGQVFARRAAAQNPKFYERLRGATIDFASLAPCGKPL